MLRLAQTCRRLTKVSELSQVAYIAQIEDSVRGYYASYGSTLRTLLRNPELGRHIQKAKCDFTDMTGDSLEVFTPHDWELARATIHRVCNLDAWNVQCRSRSHPREPTQLASSQHIDYAPNQPDMTLRSDDELDLEKIQIPSITRGKLEKEWVRLLELNDYNARIALFLTLAPGLKKVTIRRTDCNDWGDYPDLSTLSQNLVPILLLGAANMQHKQEILPEATAVSTTPFRHAETTILPSLFDVRIENSCWGYENAPMKIATPWLLPPSVKKARIAEFGNEKIGDWQIIPWTPVPGLTLGLESLRLVSCSIPAEGLGLLLQSCPSLKSLVFRFEGGEGGGIPTSCIHPQDLMPHLLAIAHSLEHLDLDGVLWDDGFRSNDNSIYWYSAKDLETIFILGYRNRDQTLNNLIDETASASVQDPGEASTLPLKLRKLKLRKVEASGFDVDSRFGSFRAFTKLRTLILRVEHLADNNAENLPTELVFILPENLEHLWIKDDHTTSRNSLVAELVRLVNMRAAGSFARLKSVTLDVSYLRENEEGSELRELSRLCMDVGISLHSRDDVSTWCYHQYGDFRGEDGEYYPWEEYLV